MEKELSLKNKKGISIMIGYVLLIAIAISLSVLVFVFLKLYTPSENPVCYDGVSLAITEVTCENETISITLENSGLFSIDGAFIRAGELGKIYKDIINEGIELFDLVPGFNGTELIPGATFQYPAMIYNATGPREIEVEPLLTIDSRNVLCDKATIRKNILCE